MYGGAGGTRLGPRPPPSPGLSCKRPLGTLPTGTRTPTPMTAPTWVTYPCVPHVARASKRPLTGHPPRARRGPTPPPHLQGWPALRASCVGLACTPAAHLAAPYPPREWAGSLTVSCAGTHRSGLPGATTAAWPRPSLSADRKAARGRAGGPPPPPEVGPRLQCQHLTQARWAWRPLWLGGVSLATQCVYDDIDATTMCPMVGCRAPRIACAEQNKRSSSYHSIRMPRPSLDAYRVRHARACTPPGPGPRARHGAPTTSPNYIDVLGRDRRRPDSGSSV